MARNKKEKIEIVEEATDAIKKPKAKAKGGYFVGDGCAITSKKGTLCGSSEVKAEFLHGGKKSLDALVELGKVEVK